MPRDHKKQKYSEKILKLFHENARNTLYQSEIRKAFDGIDWHSYRREVLDNLIILKQFLTADNNLFRFSLTERGNKYLDAEYRTKENQVNEIAVNIMTLFIKDELIILNRKKIKKYFTVIEWNGYHKMVLEYLIEKMGWLTAENNTDKFSLTREGKKYLDSLSK